jgi:2-amino-4-hydroxy-6-hydroxymethyldihydropteridine diphosphokinase
LSSTGSLYPAKYDRQEDSGFLIFGRIMNATVYLGLGSNLGDRHDYLHRAINALRQIPEIKVEIVSSFRETEPIGGPPGQPRFLNAVAQIRTDLTVHALLEDALRIEQDLGRVRSERWGPRIIDIDILMYSDLVHHDPTLTLPHPRMHERAFVLEPMAEIAPDLVHPILGLSMRQLRDQLVAARATDQPCPQPIASLSTSGRELAGQRALVTGSTSGIGRAIALELARAGADIIIHGRRAQAAEELAHLLQASQVRSQTILADLRHVEECLGLVRTAWSTWGGIDIWLNNAGADTLTGEAASWPFERKLEELLQVDVKATALLARAAGHRMKMAGHGVVLTVGWDQADMGMEGDSGQLFALAKGAVMSFTKSLARTLAPEVRVNCLAPGWIRTSWGSAASRTWQERVRRETPLGRWGTPEDVAATARWIVSPAAAFITGQVIRINGGAVQ